MSETLDLSQLPALPQTTFLHELAPLLWQKADVQALWLEGSLGRSNADRYSDVDLYVSVNDGALPQWRALDLLALFGTQYTAHSCSDFGADLFVYHVYLTAGRIYDLHIQPVSRELPEAQRLLLGWRTAAYRSALLAATPAAVTPAVLQFASQPLDPAQIHPLLVNYWINADKSRKVLYRGQDFTMYTGLYIFRQMLARLLFIEATGQDCGDLTRTTIHGLKAAAAALGAKWGAELGLLMGAPATTRLEFCAAQTQLNQAVARVGQALADQYGFTYPAALEETVRQNWQIFVEQEIGSN